jgi:hypothetical protein
MIKFLLRILSLLCLCWVGPAQNPNPHQPYHLTWVVIDTSTGEILTQTSKVTPPNIWFPDLTFDLTNWWPVRGFGRITFTSVQDT